MERLTTRNSEGVAVLKAPYQCDRCGEAIYRLADYGNGEPIGKLAEYEDLGLEPSEIRPYIEFIRFGNRKQKNF